MTDIEARELDSSEYKLWDRLVEESSQGNIFSSSEWLRAISSDFSMFKLYGIFKNDLLIGGCSIFPTKHSILKCGYSPIFGAATPYGGLVFRNEITKNVTDIESLHKSALTSLFSNFKKNIFSDGITIVNSPKIMDIRPFIWAGWKTYIRYTYQINLDNTLWDRISSRCRQTIRKALKNSINITCSDNLDEFYDLFQLNYSSQKMQTPVSKNLIKEVFNTFSWKKQCKLWMAKTDTGELAAAAIFVWDSKRAYGWVGASNPRIRENGAPSLLYWSIFKELSETFNELDLCGANTPNIVKFKSSFNPELVPYYQVEKSSIKYKVAVNAYRIIKHIKG